MFKDTRVNSAPTVSLRAQLKASCLTNIHESVNRTFRLVTCSKLATLNFPPLYHRGQEDNHSFHSLTPHYQTYHLYGLEAHTDILGYNIIWNQLRFVPYVIRGDYLYRLWHGQCFTELHRLKQKPDMKQPKKCNLLSGFFSILQDVLIGIQQKMHHNPNWA